MTDTKVNLFIVGAPKCGTTAWVEYLNSHPQVYFCQNKEPHYFNFDFPNFRWAQSLDQYLSMFDIPNREIEIIGEASIMYLYSEVAAEKIYSYNPDAKIIIFIRSYIEFLKSYHRQLINLLDEDEPDFEKAWMRQSERSKGIGIPRDCREAKFLQYRDVASFGRQMERYFSIFPSEQIKVIGFQQWTKAPRETYLDLMEFLGLKDDNRQCFEKINTAKRLRSRFIARLTRRPPDYLLNIAAVLKKMVGVERLNWASRIKVANEKRDLVKDISEVLKKEIQEALRGDALQVSKFTNYDPFSK